MYEHGDDLFVPFILISKSKTVKFRLVYVTARHVLAPVL